MKSHQAALSVPPVGYDDHVALAMGQHAAWIYGPADDYRALCHASGYDGALIIQRGSTQIGIAHAPWGIVVACRGSSQLGDWLENAQMWRVPWRRLVDRPGVGVHRGFKKQARRVEDEFLSLLYAVLPRFPGVPLYFTGHSLGSPLACFLATMAGRAAGVWCFDSPRIGNRGWAQWWEVEGPFGAVTQRVVMVHRGVQDLVTRIPLSSLGWWHFGTPQILWDGVRLPTRTAWEEYRAQHKTSMLDHWRVLTRLTVGAMIHGSRALVRALREQVDLADRTSASGGAVGVPV